MVYIFPVLNMALIFHFTIIFPLALYLLLASLAYNQSISVFLFPEALQNLYTANIFKQDQKSWQNFYIFGGENVWS